MKKPPESHIDFKLDANWDPIEIADFHAKSWQLHYRDILSDSYLDQQVHDDRRTVWQQRKVGLDENLFLISARCDAKLVGFSCGYFRHDGLLGTYIDNLHVAPSHQGRGVGRELLTRTADLVRDTAPGDNMYLYVFKKNIPAIRFYENVGGTLVQMLSLLASDGAHHDTACYQWSL